MDEYEEVCRLTDQVMAISRSLVLEEIAADKARVLSLCDRLRKGERIVMRG